ncbi:hypothetical protein AN403_2798 [Pseudomonas fluorescens]|uniref:Uncharacterized protein n=1 Tax=Pseudomonas fluorescens TaxID=294 RepID=A0A0P8Z1F0_PSEFL|nr:hypothetical protein [Pseudomonas fluorescens]KPU58776.1 hypothetical protein AN403_2798 [Pseudomonas fluorescens]
MSTFTKLSAQQQRLLDYKAMLRGRRTIDFGAPEPMPNKLLPATADDPGNQVPKSEQGLAMTFKVSKFPDYDLNDNGQVIMQLRIDGVAVGTPLTGTRPLEDSWFDQRITLPAGYTNRAGEHKVMVYLTVRFNNYESPDFVLRVDMQPPRPTLDTVVPDKIKTDGITAEYFDTNANVLLSYPGNYGDPKIDDVIEFMLAEYKASGEVDFDTARLIGTAVRLTPTTPLQTTNLTKAFLEDGADEGERAIFVYATDRKGNKSLASPPVKVDVSLIPAPKNETVDVPLHDVDNLILLADAQTPVSAVFDYDNFQKNDQLRISIDKQPLGDIDVDAVPFDFDLTYKQLFNGDLGVKTVDLEWQVRRNNKFYPPTPASKTLNVDLRKPGMPVDPDNPGTPGSPDLRLKPVMVFGTNRLEPNKLNKRDLVAGAIVTVPIFEGHKDKDRIQLRVLGVDLSEAEGGVVTLDGTETDETVLEFGIPGRLIADVGNNKNAFVDYVVSHKDVNETIALSPRQTVEIHITPNVMVQPDFAVYGVGGDGPELHCGSLVVDPDSTLKAVEVKFSGDSRLADINIKFYVQGYENTKDDTGKNIPGDIILDAASMVEKTPDAGEANTGFSVFFPWQVFDKIRNGWCTLHCSAKLDGYTTPSDPVLFRVGMFNPGNGEFCPLIR